MGLTSELGAERTVMLEQERDECDPCDHTAAGPLLSHRSLCGALAADRIEMCR